MTRHEVWEKFSLYWKPVERETWLTCFGECVQLAEEHIYLSDGMVSNVVYLSQITRIEPLYGKLFIYGKFGCCA